MPVSSTVLKDNRIDSLPVSSTVLKDNRIDSLPVSSTVLKDNRIYSLPVSSTVLKDNRIDEISRPIPIGMDLRRESGKGGRAEAIRGGGAVWGGGQREGRRKLA